MSKKEGDENLLICRHFMWCWGRVFTLCVGGNGRQNVSSLPRCNIHSTMGNQAFTLNAGLIRRGRMWLQIYTPAFEWTGLLFIYERKSERGTTMLIPKRKYSSTVFGVGSLSTRQLLTSCEQTVPRPQLTVEEEEAASTRAKSWETPCCCGALNVPLHGERISNEFLWRALWLGPR